MHVGTAIVVIAILYFMVVSDSFRRFVFWAIAAITAFLFVMYLVGSENGRQREESARVGATLEMETMAKKVCHDLETQKQCIEAVELPCQYYQANKLQECMELWAGWCPEEKTRKKCVDERLQMKKAQEEELRQREEAIKKEQDARYRREFEAWCDATEKTLTASMAEAEATNHYWFAPPRFYECSEAHERIVRAKERMVFGREKNP
jgi:hypothetical protein